MSNLFRSEQTKNFTIIGNELIRDVSLSLDARAVYILMSTYADGWRFNARHLREMTGLGKDRFFSATRELKDRDMLDIKKTFQNGKIVGATWILKDFTPPNHRSPDFRTPENKSTENRTNKKNQPKETTKEDILFSEDEISANANEEAFETWWQTYPKSEPTNRKVDKKKVRKKYLTITSKGDATPETLQTAVTNYAAQTDPQYVCAPHRWLNEERWHVHMDAPPPPPEDPDAARYRKIIQQAGGGAIQ